MTAIRRLRRAIGGLPALLAAIHDPPRQLFLRGDAGSAVLDRPAVAVVGARACSSYGRSVARSLARDLAAAGLVVVSGMARGIDGEAHRGALDAGGVTVAVLGCGIDRDYPAAHAELARRICERGGSSSPSTSRASSRRRGVSLRATGSSPASVARPSSSRRASAAAHSSRRTSRSRRGARCSPCPARSRARCPPARTRCFASAPRRSRAPRTCSSCWLEPRVADGGARSARRAGAARTARGAAAHGRRARSRAAGIEPGEVLGCADRARARRRGSSLEDGVYRAAV